MHANYIPEPFQFNPLKHHLSFIRDFISMQENSANNAELIKAVKHIGTSVMDIYTGELTVGAIFSEVYEHLKSGDLISHDKFLQWAGCGLSDFRMITLSDNSSWTVKYHDNRTRYVHLFPARSGLHTMRIKANTLKSAVLYIIVYGKDYITGEDLNSSRAMIGLSPIKEIAETAAISGMIEILRTG